MPTVRPTSRWSTDLAVTGKPAQFGRGVMQDVSDKLLGQFVACLEQRLTAPEPEPEPEGLPQAESSQAASPAAEQVAPPPPPVEALDLGSAVLPVLLKSYWKHALAALAGLAVLRRLLRR